MAEETAKALQAERDRLAGELFERTAQLDALATELQQFTYAVSHDLRAPLRAMEGFAQILLEDYAAKLDADGRHALDVIFSSARKTSFLIEDLTILSRMGSKALVPARLNMTDLVRDKVAAFRAAGAQASFSIGHLPEAWGDREMVGVVWEHLLDNAVKATRRQDQPAITITGRVEGRQAFYETRDNGIGFDPSRADRLFGVFQKLHGEEEFAGRGVGLALVKRLISRQGGTAWAEGTVNKGAAFSFSLPLPPLLNNFEPPGASA